MNRAVMVFAVPLWHQLTLKNALPDDDSLSRWLSSLTVAMYRTLRSV